MANCLEKNLSRDIECLGGNIVYRDESFSDVSLSIPFKISELGFRRHYRLPAESMLDKRVLIICESDKVAHSLKTLFEYFHYHVEVGLDAFKENGSDLNMYDIFLTEEKLCAGEVGPVIEQAEKMDDLRLVILKGREKIENSSLHRISSFLSKPITQESVYNLIVQLFDPEFQSIELGKKEDKTEAKPIPASSTAEKDEFQDTLESKRAQKAVTLDIELGQRNAKRMGLVYRKELKHFVDTFERSDRYFREIVQEKSINKIKEFCQDLESQSRVIGAESMLNFADIISLIFIYNKLDMLPIYPGRYHLELEKLLTEIKKNI